MYFVRKRKISHRILFGLIFFYKVILLLLLAKSTSRMTLWTWYSKIIKCLLSLLMFVTVQKIKELRLVFIWDTESLGLLDRWICRKHWKHQIALSYHCWWQKKKKLEKLEVTRDDNGFTSCYWSSKLCASFCSCVHLLSTMFG